MVAHFILLRYNLGCLVRYDEGTALMPVVQTKRQVPVSDKFRFMGLDEDGFDLPSDWLAYNPIISLKYTS